MDQLSVPLPEKLDAPLAALCNEQALAPSERMAVLVRYEEGTLPAVQDRIAALGGSVRHSIPRFQLLAVWLPLKSVAELSREPAVSRMELEQEFAVMQR